MRMRDSLIDSIAVPSSVAVAGGNLGHASVVPPTEINQDHLYERYDNFPVPQLENVLTAWKPVDHGNPLHDETVFYAPPSMERVRFQNEQNNHAFGPQSRSIDDEVFSQQPPLGPIVIQAEPKKEPANAGYSIYGSPSINYSELYYTNQKSKKSLPVPPGPHGLYQNGRESHHGYFQPDFLSSALDSRSADTRDYPLLWGGHNREEDSALQPVQSHGGGLQMIKPPNREKKTQTQYFYYSDDSPHYKEKLRKMDEQQSKEQGNEIISVDGIIVGPRNSLKKPAAPPKYPDDLETQATLRWPQLHKQQAPTKANAVVYSFKNDYGQKEHVGVIFDETSAPGPQVTKVLPSNKHQVLHHHHHQHNQHAAQPRHDRGHNREVYEPSDNHKQNLANFIPLEKRQPNLRVKSQEQSFPLGNPFLSPLLKARPDFFPPLQYPPLYKTKPTKLEGSFGPALPPKPQPDVILFPDEELPGVVREASRREDIVYEPEYYQSKNFTHQFCKDLLASNSFFLGVEPQGRESDYVYKTVRDMEYSRPKDILHVKPSGELYIPDPSFEHSPVGDPQPRVPILPGVSTIEEWEAIQEDKKSQEAESAIDDRLWSPDFTDALQNQAQPQASPPRLSDVFGSAINQPHDLDTGSSVTNAVVFTENYKRPGSSFKFPGKSTSDYPRPQREIVNNRQPPPGLQLQNSQRRPTGAVKVQKVEPNYKVVIGLTYDDAGPDQVSNDYDTDFLDQDQEEQQKPFGKKELYEICIEEVPKHLHRELCGYIRDGRIPPGREISKNLQPRPSKLIQGPQVLEGKFVQTNDYKVKDFNPFAGIPTELPVQINKNPQVITSNSRVNIYKPFEGELPVTAQPVTTATTVTTTTTTTTTSSSATPSRFVEIFQKKMDSKMRPLLYNKRDPSTGESRLSKPFEYFNRLTKFFSNRVQAPNGSHQNRQLPPPPRLQRQRLRTSPTT